MQSLGQVQEPQENRYCTGQNLPFAETFHVRQKLRDLLLLFRIGNATVAGKNGQRAVAYGKGYLTSQDGGSWKRQPFVKPFMFMNKYGQRALQESKGETVHWKRVWRDEEARWRSLGADFKWAKPGKEGSCC